MSLIAFFLGVIVVCILAAAFGADSRPVERGHHRPNL